MSRKPPFDLNNFNLNDYKVSQTVGDKTENFWIEVSKVKAPEGKVVLTKIDDEKGVRNEQKLIRRGNLWWHPDGSMYVYYTPTHWRKID